ncbi:hypothetical protein BC629DRAFT_1463737, partial [Irpex lacteus]
MKTGRDGRWLAKIELVHLCLVCAISYSYSTINQHYMSCSGTRRSVRIVKVPSYHPKVTLLSTSLSDAFLQLRFQLESQEFPNWDSHLRRIW